MTTIKPFWFDGNGYHLFLIDGWKIKTILGASKYLTGMDCGTEYIDYTQVWGIGGRTDYHHLFNPYSEFILGNKLYSVFWPEGIFRRGKKEPGSNAPRNKEDKYGWSLLFNGEIHREFRISDERFIRLLSNRLALIEELKQGIVRLV